MCSRMFGIGGFSVGGAGKGHRRVAERRTLGNVPRGRGGATPPSSRAFGDQDVQVSGLPVRVARRDFDRRAAVRGEAADVRRGCGVTRLIDLDPLTDRRVVDEIVPHAGP